MEKFGTLINIVINKYLVLSSSEKRSLAQEMYLRKYILGDMWWPQTEQQEGDKISKKKAYYRENPQ